MGLQTESRPADGRVRKARRRRHRTDRPVRGVVWRRAERAFDNGGNLVVLDRSRSAGTGLIQEPLDAVLQKPPTPFADSMLVDAKLTCNGLSWHAISAP